MSILFGAIAGGLAGAGAAGEKALGRMQEHEQQKSLEELRANLMFEKQKRLAELAHSQNVDMERNVRQPFEEKRQQAGFKHDLAIEGGRQKHAEALQKARLEFEQSWNEKNFEQRRQEIQSTRAYQAESLKIQKSQLDKNSIWQDPKTGAYWVVDDRTKAVKGAFNEPGTDKQLTGPLPLSDATKMVVEGSFGMAAALSKSLDPEERKLGEAYFQFGTKLINSKADPAAIPSQTNVAKFAGILKEGDPDKIAQAKKDFTEKYPQFGPTVIEAFAPLEGAGKKPDSAGIVGSAAKTPDAPSPPPSKPGIVEGAGKSLLTPATEDLGAKLDAARKNVEQAERVLQTFGMRQQRDNPKAFADAKAAAAAAKQELAAIQKQYQTAAEQEVGTLRR